MSSSRDEEPGMLLLEAVEALKASWNSGSSSIVSIGSQLRGETRLQSLLQLVLIDSELAIRAGNERTAIQYTKLFPELEPHYPFIEQRIREIRVKYLREKGADPHWGGEKTDEIETPPRDRLSLRISSKSRSLSDDQSLGMFSQMSMERTLDHPSKKEPTSRPKQPSQSDRTDKEAIPAEIAGYRILEELGEGQFGTVCLAVDSQLNRQVAIKIQHQRKGGIGLTDAFLHEARAVARLDHPNIVRLLHIDETDEGLGYLVYEYVPGDTLEKRVKQQDYSIEEAVQWIAAIARALDFAHRRGVVHRDISPRNIMIDEQGNAKLLDFGLSRLDESFYVADHGILLGTPTFMSPEQASGKPHWATSYADIFSLGGILYYTLSGRLPFSGHSVFDIRERIQSSAPTSLRSLRNEIPVKLEEVVVKAMAKEPQSRYSTGADFATALEQSVLNPEPVLVKPFIKPSSIFLPLIACAMLSVGLGFLWLAWKEYEDSIPKARIEKVTIMVERDGRIVGDLFSEEKDKILPLQSSDLYGFDWESSQDNSATVSTLIVYNAQGDSHEVHHPASSFFTLDEQTLFSGTNFVILCLSKKKLTKEAIDALPSPYTSTTRPEVIFASEGAPVVPGKQRNVSRMFGISEDFKKQVKANGVEAYFGFVLPRAER